MVTYIAHYIVTGMNSFMSKLTKSYKYKWENKYYKVQKRIPPHRKRIITSRL